MQQFEGADLPTLPPEIWHIILKLASRVPGLVDTSPLHPLSDERRSFTPVNGYHLTRRKMKRDSNPMPFILVCRQWYGLAIEFIYEFIWLNNAASLVSLAGTLQRDTISETIQLLRQHHLGWYIRSLSLHLIIWSDTPQEADALDSLFNLCQGLRILRVWSPMLGAEIDTTAIADRGSSLRVVRMDWVAHPVDVSHFGQPLLNKLHRFGMLEAIEINFFATSFGFPDKSMSFPRLHSFALYFTETNVYETVMARLAPWTLPALRSLTLVSRANMDTASLESFLRTHGPVLTSVKIQHGAVDYIASLIVAHCGSLQNLGIEFSETLGVLPPTPHLARVQIMGDATSFDDPEWFINAIETNIVANRPSLKRIQLADMSYSGLRQKLDRPSFARWDNWADKLAKDGIRFDDRRGLWGESRGEALDYHSDEFDPSYSEDSLIGDDVDDILSDGDEAV